MFKFILYVSLSIISRYVARINYDFITGNLFITHNYLTFKNITVNMQHIFLVSFICKWAQSCIINNSREFIYHFK